LRGLPSHKIVVKTATNFPIRFGRFSFVDVIQFGIDCELISLFDWAVRIKFVVVVVECNENGFEIYLIGTLAMARE